MDQGYFTKYINLDKDERFVELNKIMNKLTDEILLLKIVNTSVSVLAST